jgi:hypothetical protein
MPLIPAFIRIVAHFTTLKTALLPGILTVLIHRSTLSLVILWTVIWLTALFSTVLTLIRTTRTTWSPSTKTTLTVHPFVSHIFNLLALFNQDLKLPNTQWHNRILQFVPQPILEATTHIDLIYPIPKEAEETG